MASSEASVDSFTLPMLLRYQSLVMLPAAPSTTLTSVELEFQGTRHPQLIVDFGAHRVCHGPQSMSRIAVYNIPVAISFTTSISQTAIDHRKLNLSPPSAAGVGQRQSPVSVEQHLQPLEERDRIDSSAVTDTVRQPQKSRCFSGARVFVSGGAPFHEPAHRCQNGTAPPRLLLRRRVDVQLLQAGSYYHPHSRRKGRARIPPAKPGGPVMVNVKLSSPSARAVPPPSSSEPLSGARRGEYGASGSDGPQQRASRAAMRARSRAPGLLLSDLKLETCVHQVDGHPREQAAGEHAGAGVRRGVVVLRIRARPGHRGLMEAIFVFTVLRGHYSS
ncbi:hypothetical protein DL764_000670 [Monosporascus ibericus]|uniref:Uncharacterized protein n=1 Tax=Monosporascus ibericus TaxID=155417 RepID=A0A4Q4TW55_9PEZI|nr:hypothetical protein DL764_000670 [Monosporascus ibericus]